MEKLLLRPFLAGDELDVVNEKDVHTPVAISEFDRGIKADRVNQVVGELFRRDVGDPDRIIAVQNETADGVKEMRLAETDAAINEERIVRPRDLFGNRQ
jgi:hypothetical protein